MNTVMGREPAYPVLGITWDMIMNSKQDLQPEELGYEKKMEAPPRPVPGQYKFIRSGRRIAAPPPRHRRQCSARVLLRPNTTP